MSEEDCFNSKDPSLCLGLGSKLKMISQSVSGGADGESPNTCALFQLDDWDEEDKFYSLTFPASEHLKGLKPLLNVQESVSGGFFKEVGVEKVWASDGGVSIKVSCDPDCRFDGRVIFDG